MSKSMKLQDINACPCKQGNACDRKTFTIFYPMRYIIACPCKHRPSFLCFILNALDQKILKTVTSYRVFSDAGNKVGCRVNVA